MTKANMTFPNNFNYITPAEAAKMGACNGRKDVKFYENLASDNSLCEACHTYQVWKLGNTGMCFACTTGETDASDDYELRC